ncbi:hypothetical protein VaNZ11_002628 [Volvox africanus]|uniref:Protein kinase domain-containing protein n=1 Tax=Volvox africanus TaxID=51714 RepID=A0ABQ5RSE6_9CHLO|nr:hypothetical protein VaNZ11_002628 [Volvox africanus]
MKALCSLWLCLGGKGEGKAVELNVTPSGKDKDVRLVADGNVEVKRSDGGKQRVSAKSYLEDRDTAAWRVAASEIVKNCEAGAGKSPVVTEKTTLQERQSFLAGDLHNERTLRAILQKAKVRLSEQTQAFALEPQANGPFADSGRAGAASDPDLVRLNAQLLETCSVPRPDSRALLRLEHLLGEVRCWLAARPCPAAATLVLYTVGEGLVHAEHAIRSVGLVRYWQPENTSVFLALLQLYSDLLIQAARAAQLQRQQQDKEQQRLDKEDQKPLPSQQQQHQLQQQPREKGEQQNQNQNQQPSSGSDVVVLAADKEHLLLHHQRQNQRDRLVTEKLLPQLSEMSLEYSEQGPSQPHRNLPTDHQQVPLTFAAAALLLRPDWLDMLAEVLELLHFSEEYRLAVARAGKEPQEALAKALQLWCFLTQLVKFAAAHAHSVQRMEPCLQRLNALLAPPSGAVPRLLDLPLAEDTLVAQLHALWLLQVLYDMPDAKLLYSAPLAEYYIALHHNAMVQSYEASAADPKSAAAELCRIHATLLRSMARHPGATVRSAFARIRTVEWILQELSLESQLLPAAQQDGVADDPDTDSDSANDSDITVSDDDEGEDRNDAGYSDKLANAVRETQPRSAKMRPLSPVVSTMDSNTAAEAEVEVEARMEDGATGPGVDSQKASKGFSFTYDLNEDVERLIALEDELGREMELDGFEYDEEGKQLKARSDARLAEARAAEAAVAAAAVEQPTTPAGQRMQQQQPTSAGAGDLQSYGSLASTSRRSGGIPRLALSSLRTASISSMAAYSPVGKRSSRQGARTSHTGNGTLFVREEEEGQEPSSDDARTPSPNAATAAERVAVWSSSLMDAYAAASAGDDSKLPHPPPRSRSRGRGSFGVVGPPDYQTPSCVDSEQSQQQRPPRTTSGEDRAAVTTSAMTGTPLAPADEPTVARPREITNGSPVHAGRQGELHLLVQSSGTVRVTQPSGTPAGHGRPPLPAKPALPPLKMGSMESAAATAAAAPPSTVIPSSPSVSARAPQPSSSRAMMVLSASNRVNMLASSPTATQQQQQQGQLGPSPWAHTATAPMSSSPVCELTRQCHAGNDSSAPAVSQQQSQPASMGVLIPTLNLKSLRRRDTTITPPTDTGRTVPLSSMLRFTNGGSLSNCSGRDSANTLLRSGGTATTPASSSATYHHSHAASNLGMTSGMLHRITETEQRPPEVAYQEIACQRLLYQDRATHILMLKVLIDLLVAPWGTLDPAYVPQYPAHCGAPHAEFILLWHLNAPRNASVVHDLCRSAQRRAQQAATSAVRRTAGVVTTTAPRAPQPRNGSPQGSTHQQQPTDSARDYSPSSSIVSFQPKIQQQPTVQAPAPRTAAGASSPGAGAAAVVAAPTRAGAVTRALQLLSRPLFDTSRYTNLQFVARGTFGDIYRARMEPPRTQAWPSPTSLGEPSASPQAGAAPQPPQPQPMQVVIKTITLPSSPHDSCVLADVFGEVSVMERFKGHECICQLLDYGMRDDAYWIVMRRYRCSLAEWRGRQKPLSDLRAATGGAAAVAAAARLYLSALTQVVDALRLLASHHVVHFDLKCSNVLIEPLPGVRDGELWAPVGSDSVGTATANDDNNDDNAHRAPFRCVLADFGEARAYRCAEEAFTARNRGTEVFKSPEMLMLNAASRTSMKPASATTPPLPTPLWTDAAVAAASDSPFPGESTSPSAAARGCGATIARPRTADAQRQGLAGAGLASDIWSLGCLAYELLSGTVLFGGDYASVTHRVAFGSGEQLTLTDSERARLGNLPELVGLVEWILARNPAMRPSLDQIGERIELIRSALGTAQVLDAASQ